MMGTKPHTQLDADLAAGMGMPDNGPKLMSMWAFFFYDSFMYGKIISELSWSF